MFKKYFRMLIIQESGCTSGMDCFRNLNSSLKNQKPELFIWNLMVKYWVRQSYLLNLYRFSKHFGFHTSFCQQLLCTGLNRGIQVWYFFPDAFCFRCTNSGFNFVAILMDGKMNNIIILQHQKPWYFSPISDVLSSKWAPVFILNLKYWYLSKTIPFLKCPLIPIFLLLIKARRCDQKTETFSPKEPFAWEFFVLLFCISIRI